MYAKLIWTEITVDPQAADVVVAISNLHVMYSGGGYYIGRLCKVRDDFGEGFVTYEEPFSRESDYFRTREDAEKHLTEGWQWRDAPENETLYKDYPELQKQITKTPVN